MAISDQLARDRESRLQFIEHRARSAQQLSSLIRELNTTLDLLRQGNGSFLRSLTAASDPDFRGLDGSDQDEIRKLAIVYLQNKLAVKEAEFDKL